MIDHTNEQQRTLEQKRAELAARRATEVKLQFEFCVITQPLNSQS